MPLINGDDGPNSIVDTPDDDTINGLLGDDTITVTNGNDSANGGGDFDTLFVSYEASSADISGGLTNFVYGDGSTQNVGFTDFERFIIMTGSGNDSIGTAQFSGNDIVNLGAGNDLAETGVGDDTVNGGSGNDLIDVGTGDDTADGGADNDRISANMSAATGAILWNLQINTYSGAIGSFTNFEYFGIVSTGDGNDQIYTGTGNFDDTVNLGGGDDLIHVVLGGDTVNGQGGEDTLYVDYGGSTAAVTTGLTSFGNGVDRNVVFAAFEIFVITTGSSNDVISTADYSGDDTLTLGNGNDIAATGAGADTLNGGGGADALDGGSGADLMNGGDGDDLFFVDNAGDQAVESNALPSGGIDTVQSGVNHTLAANIERLTLVGAAISGTGNGINNVITGNSNANVLNGGGGQDTLEGGNGNDTYFVDSNGDVVSETSEFGGTDVVRSTISHTLAANVENLTLEGSSNISGFGNSLANIITGNSGNNTLNGGGGVDSLRGGDGNDTYNVDDAGDVVIETSATGGTDLVQSSINFILGGNVENLTLTGSGNINGTGNALANVITGNSGNNTLNGGAGVDSMRGGDGDDFYLVNDAGDLVIETSAAGGTDTVQSSVSFLLGGNVENLTLIGTATNGTGNALNNTITGNGQANVLNGGFGADTMIGGLGNDIYQVDNSGDLAFESTAGGGVDLVQSSVNFTLAQHVDNLTLTGAGVINGTGNGTANTINGNGADNILDGAGNNDIINAGNGADTLLGGAGNDTLDGSTGDDDLYGGLGNDTMTGGSGSDGFFFDTALNGATNVDSILGFSVAADTIFLDDASFAGLPGAGTLAAGAFRAGTVALDADDRLLYDAATGQIRWDADGVGGAAAILFATVAPGTALTNADFVGY